MKPKSKVTGNESTVTMEKLPVNGMYLIELWGPDGSLLDKYRCDDKQRADEIFKGFVKENSK